MLAMEDLRSHLLEFVSLDSSSLEALVQLFKPTKISKGSNWAATGKPSTKIGFVNSGVFRAFHLGSEGQEFTKVFFRSPSIIGAYSSLITGRDNQVYIECLQDGEIFEADYQQILSLYEDFPMIERLNRVMAENFFVRNEDREIGLVMMDAKDRYKQFQLDYVGIENQIPQYQVASYLGISPTQLSRIRADMAKGT
jgi:CRP-like cAMP-binding protein